MFTTTYQKNNMIFKYIDKKTRFFISKWMIKYAYKLTPNYSTIRSGMQQSKVSSLSGATRAEMQTSKKAFKNKAIREGRLLCNSCGRRFHEKKKQFMTVDHIKPLSKGGPTKWGNLQLLCLDCHKEKTRLENIIEAQKKMDLGGYLSKLRK